MICSYCTPTLKQATRSVCLRHATRTPFAQRPGGKEKQATRSVS
jgi:hypothetical protein